MYQNPIAVVIILLAFGASLAFADEPGTGGVEPVVTPPTEASRQEQAPVSGSTLNPYGLPAEGFIAPTFEGPWRFRAALNGWLPTTINISVKAGGESGSTTEGLDWLVARLDYLAPFNGEVRKGSFGFFAHTFFFKVHGTRDAGIARINWNDEGFWIDTGLSYELGRWALGDGPRAPELTIEPFVAARLIRQSVDVDFQRLDIEDESDTFSTYVPIIGLRAFLDLTEHWNLHFEGDYGGFGVGDNHQTWHALGLVGYRWPGWGLHWNLQAGYRALRVFDLRTSNYEAREDVFGPNLMLSVDF